MSNYDFLLERRLKELDPNLHSRFSDTVFALQQILSNYKLIFPLFTDHTELHTLNIIEFCNKLIGDQIEKLNADEIYSILMGCYFHDTGMGVSQNDFVEFSKKIDFGDYFETHSKDNYPEIVRNFHNEYSGLFIKKYARFFEFPSEAHQFAIIQISRGHRKTNLYNKEEYPVSLETPNGNSICLPYLAALVRLADEIDVTASRNSEAIYDLSKIVEEVHLIEFMKHEAVKGLEIKDDEFVMYVSTKSEKILNSLYKLVEKMKKTLDECRDVVNNGTPYQIKQKTIRIERI